jgi:hypothetical protein
LQKIRIDADEQPCPRASGTTCPSLLCDGLDTAIDDGLSHQIVGLHGFGGLWMPDLGEYVAYLYSLFDIDK